MLKKTHRSNTSKTHKSNKLIDATATLVGCTIGAGILSIPYVVSRAGFLTGVIDLVVIGLLMLFINLMLGEVTLRTRKNHQLTGYAEKYLGRVGKWLMTIAMFLSANGAIIAYLIMTGTFLSELFHNTQDFSIYYSIIFFVIMAVLIYLGLEIIEKSEVIMMYLFIGIIILISIIAMPHININNLLVFNIHKLMIPYGVVLFAFLGMAALPEMREEVVGEEKKLKKAIFLGTLIPFIVYFIFALSVVGVTGDKTTRAAIPGLVVLGGFIGNLVVKLGLLFGILTMATTFLALGLALKEMYNYDFKLNKNLSWFLATFIPFIAFILGIRNFINVLSITGAVAGGLMGFLVVLMHSRAVKMGDRKPEFRIKSNLVLNLIILLLFIIGVIYQLFIEITHSL